MRIFIIGYMLCGKTTIGKKLAKRLSYSFVDTDSFIENKYHYSVEDIFRNFSEKVFRNMETEVLNEIILQQDDIVVATGGGLPCFNDNMKTIKNNGTSIYLKMTDEQILSRLKQSKHKRPLLKDLSFEEQQKFICSNLKDREKFYLQADFITNGLNCDIEDIIKKAL